MSEKPVLIVSGATPAGMQRITEAAQMHGMVAVDERQAQQYPTTADHWPEIHAETITLTCMPDFAHEAVAAFNDNPHRAKKLKGRNRRKW